MTAKILVGTAGWSIPRANRRRFPVGASTLARYAQVFPAVEINSTRELRRRGVTTWCVFDNTASGAATANALALVRGL